MHSLPSPALLLALSLGLLLPASTLAAQQPGSSGYLNPPQLVEDILTRDAHTDALENLSPDGRHMLIPIRAELSTLELMSRKTYRLGMLEIVPEANREWRLSTYGITGFKIYSMEQQRERVVQLPTMIQFISDLTWSPDGSHIAFLAHLAQGTQVWRLDVSRTRAEPAAKIWVMATLAGRPRRGPGPRAPSALQWTPDGGLVTLIVPPGRGEEPTADSSSGPIIRRTREKPTPTSTYPFLLRTPHDAALFKHYTTSQVALLQPGKSPQPIGLPGMFLSVRVSPDGQHLLTERIIEPLSYITSFNSFARRLEVLDFQGRLVSKIRDIPLQEALLRAGRQGPAADLPRNVAWRPDGAGLSLLWREPKADSDGENEEGSSDSPPRKDRLMLLAAPFAIDSARALVTTRRSLTEVSYSADGRYAFSRLTGRREDGLNKHDIVAFDLNASNPDPLVLAADIDPDDPLQDPGSILTTLTPNGVVSARLSSDAGSVFLSGDGAASDLRKRPFIDRVTIFAGQKRRIFESDARRFQQPIAFLDNNLAEIVISQESPTEFPNNYLRGADGSLDQLTHNSNPFPEVAGVRRIPFEFKRRDGLTVQGRISLPVGYQEGTRVPGVFWTYPREYANAKAYRRAAIERYNLNAFPRMGYRNASDIWLTQGFAVIEPDIPILGENNRYNDNYIAHLVDSMYAAIRKVDGLGFVDVDRLGHGGHSYGAFATANILARTPFFKAGIAGDGAYNRSLTPLTFQRERRFLWEAEATIVEMSPFFNADHLETPLLMYHGAVDNNTGTFLIQSERMIQALTGLGKTAVLYIYPYESHGPRAIETYMDMWNRWLGWFDKYVKGEEDDQVSDSAGSR